MVRQPGGAFDRHGERPPELRNPAGHEEIWLCDATSGQKLAALPNFPSASGTVVAFSPDGHYMGVGEGLGVLHVYDVSRYLSEGTPIGGFPIRVDSRPFAVNLQPSTFNLQHVARLSPLKGWHPAAIH